MAYSLAFVRNFISCHSDGNRNEHPISSEALGNCHPVLDTGSRMKAPSFGNVAAYDWPRIKFRMTTCQARDDNYRGPHLEEGALVNNDDIFR